MPGPADSLSPRFQELRGQTPVTVLSIAEPGGLTPHSGPLGGRDLGTGGSRG